MPCYEPPDEYPLENGTYLLCQACRFLTKNQLKGIKYLETGDAWHRDECNLTLFDWYIKHLKDDKKYNTPYHTSYINSCLELSRLDWEKDDAT